MSRKRRKPPSKNGEDPIGVANIPELVPEVEVGVSDFPSSFPPPNDSMDIVAHKPVKSKKTAESTFTRKANLYKREGR